MLNEQHEGLKVIFPNVILLAYSTDGLVIAISRRGEFDKLGLPGGKMELGETTESAIIREIKEELNYDLDPSKLEPIYKAKEGEANTLTWRYNEIIPLTELPVINSENCLITGRTLEQLTNKDISPFHEYNTGLLNHIKSGAEIQWVN